MCTRQYVIIRSSPSGCWAGELVSRDGATVVLKNARRLWYWAGAASLSQLAAEGTSRPGECKFPPEVSECTVLEVCEILAVADEARKSIAGVPIWRS